MTLERVRDLCQPGIIAHVLKINRDICARLEIRDGGLDLIMELPGRRAAVRVLGKKEVEDEKYKDILGKRSWTALRTFDSIESVT
jgi:hypothetical protein